MGTFCKCKMEKFVWITFTAALLSLASADPCDSPSTSSLQFHRTVESDGEIREYRLSAPNSDAGTKLPIVAAFHGGGGAGYPFPQEVEFDQLGEQEKFIMIYAVAQERPASEGEWYLNSANTSFEDLNYLEAMVDQLKEEYCVDESRLYGIGYSLGSMFSYEIACHLNRRFAAVASYAGTMPVEPKTCDLGQSIAVLDIHGKLDTFVNYYEEWDWKEGEFVYVGTMKDVPSNVAYWADKHNCEEASSTEQPQYEHVVNSGCDDGIRVEHYGMEFSKHGWPDQIGGDSTPQVMWDFLSQFTK